MTLRELVTKIGFEVEEEKLDKAKEGIEKIMETVRHLAEVFAVIETGKEFLEVADRAERTQMAFEAFLGSAEEAKKVLEEVGSIKGSGVFAPGAMKGAAQQLVSVGMEAKTLIPTLTSLGNVAAIVGKGNPEMLGQLTDMYALIQSRNEVSGRQLRGMTQMQIPIVQELAKELGVSDQQIYHMTISAEQFNRAFKAMSESRFTDGMVRASRTWSGMLQVISNQWHGIAHEVGEYLLPFAKEIGTYISAWLSNNKEGAVKILSKAFEILIDLIDFVIAIIDDLMTTFFGASSAMEDAGEVLGEFEKGLMHTLTWLFKFRYVLFAILITFGLLKAAMVAQAVAIKAYTFFTEAAAAAQWLWDAAMNANPIGILILAITALVAAGIALYNNWQPIKEFFIGLWDSITSGAEKAWAMIKKIPGVSKIISVFSSKEEDNSKGGAGGAGVPHYAKGTDYVPRTGLAMIHQGEQIIPAGQGGTKTTIVQNSFNVPVTLQVPMGTPEAQGLFLKKICKQVFTDNLQSILQQTYHSVAGA